MVMSMAATEKRARVRDESRIDAGGSIVIDRKAALEPVEIKMILRAMESLQTLCTGNF